MNYRALAVYAEKPITEIKEVFKPIVEAMKEAGLGDEITMDIVDLWQSGSPLVNRRIFLKKLGAVKMLGEFGVKPKHADQALKGGIAIDDWILFESACLYSIGEEVSKDFETLVLEPIQQYFKNEQEEKVYKRKRVSDAQKAIKPLSGSISKAIIELEKIEPWVMAGRLEESIKIKLIQIETLIQKRMSS